LPAKAHPDSCTLFLKTYWLFDKVVFGQIAVALHVLVECFLFVNARNNLLAQHKGLKNFIVHHLFIKTSFFRK